MDGASAAQRRSSPNAAAALAAHRSPLNDVDGHLVVAVAVVDTAAADDDDDDDDDDADDKGDCGEKEEEDNAMANLAGSTGNNALGALVRMCAALETTPSVACSNICAPRRRAWCLLGDGTGVVGSDTHRLGRPTLFVTTTGTAPTAVGGCLGDETVATCSCSCCCLPPHSCGYHARTCRSGGASHAEIVREGPLCRRSPSSSPSYRYGHHRIRIVSGRGSGGGGCGKETGAAADGVGSECSGSVWSDAAVGSRRIHTRARGVCDGYLATAAAATWCRGTAAPSAVTATVTASRAPAASLAALICAAACRSCRDNCIKVYCRRCRRQRCCSGRSRRRRVHDGSRAFGVRCETAPRRTARCGRCSHRHRSVRHRQHHWYR